MSVPPQPTLYDGEVVLRPWTLDDLDAVRLQRDQEIEHWFGFPAGMAHEEDLRHAIETGVPVRSRSGYRLTLGDVDAGRLL